MKMCTEDMLANSDQFSYRHSCALPQNTWCILRAKTWACTWTCTRLYLNLYLFVEASFRTEYVAVFMSPKLGMCVYGWCK